MDATEFLKNKIRQMDEDDRNFANAMKREPVANMQAPTPSRKNVEVRKSTTEDESDRAAAFLATAKDRS